jgi:hypothetical protein
MTQTSSKRKREEDHDDGAKNTRSAKNSRRSLRQVRQYSVDDYADYLTSDGSMQWELVHDSFKFDIRFLNPNQKKPSTIAHGTEPLHFESDADPNLNVEFVVQPVEVWRSMNRYRRFTSKLSGSITIRIIWIGFDIHL